MLRKIGTPSDVNKNYQIVFEKFCTPESIAFLRTELVRVATAIEHALRAAHWPENQKENREAQLKYVVDYILPQIIPDPELDRDPAKRIKQMTKYRNIAWVLATHGIIRVEMDEKSAAREPVLRISIPSEMPLRIVEQTLAFFASEEPAERGNYTQVPVYVGKLVQGRPTSVRNVWAALKNCIPRRHTIPRTVEAVEKLIKQDVRKERGEWLEWKSVDSQTFLSEQFFTELQNFVADNANNTKGKRVSAEIGVARTAHNRLTGYRNILNQMADVSNALPTDMNDPAFHAKRDSLQRLLKQISEVESDTREKYKKARGQSREVYRLLIDAYADLSQKRGEFQDILDAALTHKREAPSKRKKGRAALRAAVESATRINYRENGLVNQLMERKNLEFPFPSATEKGRLNSVERARLQFYLPIRGRFYEQVARLRKNGAPAAEQKDVRNLEVIESGIQKWIVEPILKEPDDTFTSTEDTRRLQLQAELNASVDEMVADIEAHMRTD